KNFSGYAIKCVGTDGSEKNNVVIRDLKVMRDAADSGNWHLIYADYVDDLSVKNVVFSGGLWYAIGISNCDNFIISDCDFIDGKIGGVLAVGSNGIINNSFFYGTAEMPGSYYGCNLRTSPDCRVLSCHFHDFDVATGEIAIGVWFEVASENSIIDGCHFYNIYSYADGFVFGVHLGTDSHHGSVINCNFRNILGFGSGILDVRDKGNAIFNWSSDDCKIGNNNVENCGYGITLMNSVDRTLVIGNRCIDNGQLIDRGGCESTTSPMIFGETVPVISNVLWARNNAEAYEGTYSRKYTKNIAAGSAANVYLTDSTGVSGDVHGLIPGKEYTWTMWMIIPTGIIVASEITLTLRDHNGSTYQSSTANPAAVYEVWQKVTVTRTLRADATSFDMYINVAAAAEDTEYFYVDNIRLQPLGVHNEHQQNFLDNGTDTQVG
ncbi:hypothetical protein LCGC14_2456720, partial [marine sediment metagenome]